MDKNKINKIKVFVVLITLAFLIQLIIRLLILYPVTISSNSMAPAFKKGDRVFIIYPNLSKITRGDLILIKNTRAKNTLFCKIAAIEGDSLSIHNRHVIVNNKDVYTLFSNEAKMLNYKLWPKDSLAEIQIRPGRFFCLNSNAEMTQDSRTLGPLRLKDITGKIIFKNILGYSL